MIDWTDQEKYVIAEFVYSRANDILIKSDAIALLNVFDAHELIKQDVNALVEEVNDNRTDIVKKCIELLNEHIPHAQGQDIMNSYYSGKL